MSVWNDPCFNLDAAQSLYRIAGPDVFTAVPALLRVETYGKIHGEKGLVSDLIRSNDLGLEDIGCDGEHGENDELIKLLTSRDLVLFGLKAVYYLLKAYSDEKDSAPTRLNFKSIDELYSNMIGVVAPSTQVNPKVFQKEMLRLTPFANRQARHFEKLSEAVVSLRMLKPSKSIEDYEDLKAFPKHIWDPAMGWHATKVKDLVVLSGLGFHSRVILLLTPKDIDRVYKTAACIACNYQYIDFMSKQDPVAAQRGEKMMDLIFESMTRTNQITANYLARAFHVNHTLTLTKLYDTDPAIIIADYKHEQLQNLVGIDEVKEILLDLKPKEVQEIARLYKCLPAPDFDIIGTLKELKELHDNPHTVEDPYPDAEKLILREYKRNMILAYRKTHGSNPGQVHMPVSNRGIQYNQGEKVYPSEAEIDNLDLTGAGNYHAFGADYYHLLADKTLAPPKKPRNSAELRRTSNSDRSTVHHMLFDPHIRDTFDIAKCMKDGYTECDNYVQIAWKAESHKPRSRIFFMAPIDNRLIMSEVEKNISKYLKNTPANLMSIDPVKKERRLRKISDPNVRPSGALENTKAYIISFDLSKCSPKMPTHALQRMYKFWGNFFDMEHVYKMTTMFGGSQVVQRKQGIDSEYRNPGRPYEGFNGRAITYDHIAVMAAAIRVCADKKLVSPPGQLGVFIDDGIAKLEVYDEPGNIEKVMKVLEHFYLTAGYKIGLAKTFVSPKGGTILNEVFWKGIRISPGIRAFAKISPDYANPAATIVEDMSEIFARSQGAVKAGTPWPLAYAKYMYELSKTIHRWIRTPLDQLDKLAVQMFAPKGLGGFGAVPLQGLVSTMTTSLHIEGIGILRTYARMNPKAKPYVSAVLNQELRGASMDNLLREPARIRRSANIIVENRLTVSVLDYLREHKDKLNARMLEFLESYDCTDLRELAHTVWSAGIRSHQVLQKIFETTPVAYVEAFIGKFKRSATLITLLGRQTIGRIRTQNKADVKSILSNFPQL